MEPARERTGGSEGLKGGKTERSRGQKEENGVCEGFKPPKTQLPAKDAEAANGAAVCKPAREAEGRASKNPECRAIRRQQRRKGRG